MIYFLASHLKSTLKQLTTASIDFQFFMSLEGQIFRALDGRYTKRLKVGEQFYFIKQHTGVGFKEIIKNLLQFRLPVVSAKNEWQALDALKKLHVAVPEVVAYGQRGWHPAYLQSFVMMKEVAPTISLEELTQTWKVNPPHIHFKHKLISAIAKIAQQLHCHGINHRDFYLCHFLLDITEGIEKASQQPTLYLIDLHRATIRRKVPKRWIIKDLAALMFSCRDVLLTKKDYYRFIKAYHQLPLRQALQNNQLLWQSIYQRGNNYRDHTK